MNDATEKNNFKVVKNCKNVYKATIYSKYKGREKEIRKLILELIKEHNNKKETLIKLNERSWSIPFWMNEKVEKYFDCN